MRSFTLLLWVIPAVLSSAVELNVYHRVVNPGASSGGFSRRGTVTLDDTSRSASYLSSEDRLALGSDLNPDAAYQVALERPGANQDDWSFTTTKACHLSSRISDSLAIVLNGEGKPFSLNYHIYGVPANGACPPSRGAPLTSALFGNTTVTVKHPYAVPSPILRAPPPLTPEGKPVVVAPEKSLIQKYWIYAVPIVIILLLAPDDPPKADSAAASG